jgi:hypothetical protein
MIQRCTNPAASRYARYGGRGIKVCPRWRASYEAFLVDMGRKPTPKHSIDRINSDGDYEPASCQWATASEQARNRSATKLTGAVVAEIRDRRSKGETTVALGAAFGVHSSTVSRICAREMWS